MEKDSDNTISWLHISDLHILKPVEGEDFDHKVVADQFLDFLRNRFPEETVQRPKFVVITGDLAFAGSKKDYGQWGKSNGYSVMDFLKGLTEALHIDRKMVFPVAGNHDVNREKYLKDRDHEKGVVLAKAARPKIANAIFTGTTHAVLRRTTLKRLDEYCRFVKELWGRGYKSRSDEDILWYAREIYVGPEKKKVGIAGFCSSWVCHSLWFVEELGEKSEPTDHLTLVERKVRDLADSVKHCDVTLALMHHGYDITGDRNTAIQHRLETAFDFVLSGHEHIKNWAEPTLKRAFKVRAGCLYLRRDYPNTATITEVNVKTGAVRLFTIRYRSDEGAGFWDIDKGYDPTENYANQEYQFNRKSGALTFSLRRKGGTTPPPPPPAEHNKDIAKCFDARATRDCLKSLFGTIESIIALSQPETDEARTSLTTSVAKLLRTLQELRSTDENWSKLKDYAKGDISGPTRQLDEAIVRIITYAESRSYGRKLTENAKKALIRLTAAIDGIVNQFEATELHQMRQFHNWKGGD